MFVIVMPTEVKKGQAVFLGYLLSNVVAARVSTQGEVWWYPAVADNASPVLLSRSVLH